MTKIRRKAIQPYTMEQKLCQLKMASTLSFSLSFSFISPHNQLGRSAAQFWVGRRLGQNSKVIFWRPEPYQKQKLLMLVLLPVLTGVFLALDERNTIFPPNYPLFTHCCCHLNIKPMLLKENIFNKWMSQGKYFQQKDVTRIFVFLFRFCQVTARQEFYSLIIQQLYFSTFQRQRSSS